MIIISLIIKVWDTNAGSQLLELESMTEVLSISLLPRGHLASGCGDGQLVIWDLESRNVFKTLRGHMKGVFSLKTLPNGNLVSGSWDATIKIWNPYASDNELITTITANDIHYTNNLTVTSKGNIVACFTNRFVHLRNNDPNSINIVRVWTPDGLFLKQIRIPCHDACSVLVLKNGKVAIGVLSGQVKIFDLNREIQTPFIIQDCHKGPVVTLAQTFEGHLITAFNGKDSKIKIWNYTKNFHGL